MINVAACSPLVKRCRDEVDTEDVDDAAERIRMEGTLEELEPPAPSRDDTRYPRSGRGPRLPGGGGLRRAAILGVIVASVLVPRILSEPDDDPAPEPVASSLEITSEVRAYLNRVERICRAHDRAVARQDEGTPVWEIARAEAAVTRRIASLSAPRDAREIRRRLLGVRRMLDRTARWMARVMSKSERPHRIYRQRIQPVIAQRIPRMYQTFGSFGVHCSMHRAQRRS